MHEWAVANESWLTPFSWGLSIGTMIGFAANAVIFRLPLGRMRRVEVAGSSGQILTADSTAPSGARWAGSPVK